MSVDSEWGGRGAAPPGFGERANRRVVVGGRGAREAEPPGGCSGPPASAELKD